MMPRIKFNTLSATRNLFLLIYGIISTLALIGAYNPFSINWPFELFLSYARHLIIIFPLFLLMAVSRSYKTAFIFSAICGIAFWPVFSFDKFSSSLSASDANECSVSFTVISANLQNNVASLELLAELTKKDFTPDLIGIYSIPKHIDSDYLLGLFPQHPYQKMLTVRPDGVDLESHLAILSRRELSNETGLFGPLGTEIELKRAMLKTQIHISPNQVIDVFALHPRMPLSSNSHKRRNALLNTLKEEVETSRDFIIMGDLNIVPWSPSFKSLPGERAGDPRLISTWDANRPWMGIPIDHILISNRLTLKYSDILPKIGSDHYPIFAEICPPISTLDQKPKTYR